MAAVIEAAKETPVFPLAALPLFAEKPHQGHRTLTTTFRPGALLTISNTATGMPVCLYDSGTWSCCSGYFRDAETNNDYAVNRYHQPGMGRFLSPDPSGTGAVDPNDPSSWNGYAYAGADPINLYDPDGLDVCGDEGYSYNGQYLGTIVGVLSTFDEDVTLLAETEYTESGHSSSTNSSAEELMIGEVVMNRWALVNGYWHLYPSAHGGPLPVTVWGTPGGLENILQNGQFASWSGSSLAPSAQNNLNAALNADLNTSLGQRLCGDLAFAITTAIGLISQAGDLFQDPSSGLIPLAFNSNPGANPVPGYMQQIGSFGDKNVFYGAPLEDFSSLLTPVPLPPSSSPSRPRRPGRRSRPGGPITVQ